MVTPGGAGPASVIEHVEMGPARLEVAVPRDWERLEPFPGLPLAARQREYDQFQANVTVALDWVGDGPGALATPEALVAGLDDAVVVDATEITRGTASGRLAVIVHAVGVVEVVVFQAQLRCGSHQVAVSYSAAVEHLPRWAAPFERFLDHLAVGGMPSK